MAYWNSRGLRGSALEDIINVTNDIYRKKGIALIQKIPTPIKPVKFNSSDRTISLAYFEQKSTIDYIGIVQGIPICFDAKETRAKSLPIANIHEHQIEFMKDYVKQGGIAFLLVHFVTFDEYYMLPFEQLEKYWCNAQAGGRKSIPYQEFLKEYEVKRENGMCVHYLRTVQVYLENIG